MSPAGVAFSLIDASDDAIAGGARVASASAGASLSIAVAAQD